MSFGIFRLYDRSIVHMKMNFKLFELKFFVRGTVRAKICQIFGKNRTVRTESCQIFGTDAQKRQEGYQNLVTFLPFSDRTDITKILVKPIGLLPNFWQTFILFTKYLVNFLYSILSITISISKYTI